MLGEPQWTQEDERRYMLECEKRALRRQRLRFAWLATLFIMTAVLFALWMVR